MYIDTIEHQKLHQLISSAPINAKIEIRTGLHCLYDTLMDVSYAKKIKKRCIAILACTKKQVHTRKDTKVLLTIDIHDDLICMRNASKMIFVYFLFRFFGMICFFTKIYTLLYFHKSLSILQVTRKNILKHK